MVGFQRSDIIPQYAVWSDDTNLMYKHVNQYNCKYHPN